MINDSSDGLDFECNLLPVRKKRRIDIKCLFCQLKGSTQRKKLLIGSALGKEKVIELCNTRLEFESNDVFCSQLKDKLEEAESKPRWHLSCYNGFKYRKRTLLALADTVKTKLSPKRSTKTGPSTR